MKRRPFLVALGALLSPFRRVLAEAIAPTFRVTLPEAHKGTLEIDTRLLDSYVSPEKNLRQFYLDARAVFQSDSEAGFVDSAIVDLAKKHSVKLMGGPMLGDLRSDGLTMWMRPATEQPIQVEVDGRTFATESPEPGAELRLAIDGLDAHTQYQYRVSVGGEEAANGTFMTAPGIDDKAEFRIAFGSCCHKIGVHNPNLFGQIVRRKPHAMMLLGDIAVDDRNNEINMHRADYQLRDVSRAWRSLVSQVPVFASWDDHDYFDNDLSGIPRKYSAEDRNNVRSVYQQNWVNPEVPEDQKGIYFSTRVGPVEIIMLDTRSCRDGKKRREYGSYLGRKQMKWLKNTLRDSTAPFKVISSGTMWSDYVSKAKDSWGSWDIEGREEIFSLIEENRIGGVLLVSGDRHGARGFRIPRPSGHTFYEFEPATLGGVSGPAGLVKDCPEQLFGYSGQDDKGQDFVAVGEFTFDTRGNQPSVTFRLISQHGEIKEEIRLSMAELTPA